MILLIFILTKMLDSHMKEYGLYDITTTLVIQFILTYVVITGDYGTLLEICHLVYIILKDDTFIGY